MTSSGLSAPKIAVPATMTLLPTWGRFPVNLAEWASRLRRTCLSTGIDRLRTHTSIDLDVLVGESCAEFCDLGHAALDELLPAAPWRKRVPFSEAKLMRRKPGEWEKHRKKEKKYFNFRVGGDYCSPGYTVMTRSRSASSPTSSDIDVEGVSGEIATPAFMCLSWIA